MKRTFPLLSSGAIISILASLCCIAPLLGLLVGAGSLASNFTWLEPVRPFLIVFTLLILGFAWYNVFVKQDKKESECGTACPPKKKEKVILICISVFSLLALSFPSYSSYFDQAQDELTEKALFGTVSVEFSVQGMTCSGCESTVNNQARQVKGVTHATTSYDSSNALIQYNPDETSVGEILNFLQKTGYTIDIKK